MARSRIRTDVTPRKGRGESFGDRAGVTDVESHVAGTQPPEHIAVVVGAFRTVLGEVAEPERHGLFCVGLEVGRCGMQGRFGNQTAHPRQIGVASAGPRFSGGQRGGVAESGEGIGGECRAGAAHRCAAGVGGNVEKGRGPLSRCGARHKEESSGE